MGDIDDIMQAVNDVLGEEACGMECCEPEIFKNHRGWNLFLEGFMEPWPLGRTVAEAKASIQEYARMGFGLS